MKQNGLKKAVVMYFPIQKMETWEAGIFEYHDKMELKDYAAKGVRVVQEHQLVTALTYQAE
jgi:hypothetical protein